MPARGSGKREGAQAAQSFTESDSGPGRIRFYDRELDALLQGVDGPVARDLVRKALRCQGAAKRLCPVDTGRLRASIAWRLERDARGLVAVVGTNVSYAAFVEFGTRRMAARPYLRPALMEATRS